MPLSFPPGPTEIVENALVMSELTDDDDNDGNRNCNNTPASFPPPLGGEVSLHAHFWLPGCVLCDVPHDRFSVCVTSALG